MKELPRMKPGESAADYFYRSAIEFAQWTEEEKDNHAKRNQHPTQRSTQQQQSDE